MNEEGLIENRKKDLKRGKELVSKRKYNDAIRIFEKYAGKNDGEAEFYLGRCYTLKKKLSLARYWYQRAALQGIVSAQFNLGTLYLIDDLERSLFWFKKAAANGHARAQQQIYLINERIEQDNRTNKDIGDLVKLLTI